MKPSRSKILSALLGVVIAALVAFVFRLPSPDALPRCLNSSLIAFQTARSPEEAAQVWKQLGQAQPKLAKGIYADFAFIAAYGFLFLLLAGTAKERRVRFARSAGALAIASTIVTAVADVGENIFTLLNVGVLRHGIPTPQQIAMMRWCSLTKWAACGITLILLWWALTPSRRGSALYRLVALAAGMFSLIGGSLGVLGWWDNSKFELVIPFFGLSLLLQFPLFWFFWNDVMGQPEVDASEAVQHWELKMLPPQDPPVAPRIES